MTVENGGRTPAPAALAEVEMMRQVLGASRDVVCLIDAETGTCLYTSPSCLALIGYDADELIGTDALVHVLRDDLASVMEAMMRLVKTAEPLMLRFRMVHRHGHLVWVEASARPPAAGSSRFGVGLRDVTESVELEELLLSAALMDPVSGLPNRRLLDDELRAAVARAERSGSGLALVVLDLDDFKQVNDTHGHAVGDMVLRAVGQRLSAAVRAGDVAARYGGDEFVAVLHDVQVDAADVVVARLMASLDEPIETTAGSLRVTASIGVAHSNDGQDAAALLDAADRAMYVDKRADKARGR